MNLGLIAAAACIAAAVLVAYLVVLAFSPARACSCQKRGRRPCGRCRGTGLQFRTGAPASRRALLFAVRSWRGRR